MAASRTTCLFFTATTLCCLLPSAAAAAKPDLAIQVCKNTTDFAFCRAAVYSDSHTRGADQYELVDVIFRLADRNATDTRDYIAAEIKSGGGGLEKCLANYKKSIEILGNMLNDVNSETYDDLASQSMDVERSVRSCRGGEGLQLQGRWGQLAKRNQNMLKLANMCYVISKLFLVFI